jgi:hypothetical protein
MAFFYVQYYYPLPIIIEDFGGMGEPTRPRQSFNDNQSPPTDGGCTTAQQNVLLMLADTTSHSLAQNIQRPIQYSGFEGYNQPQFGGPNNVSSEMSTMNMRSMAGALPDYPARSFPQQSFQQMPIGVGNHSHASMYQLPQGVQFAGQASNAFGHSGNSHFPQHFSQTQQLQRQYPGMAGASAMSNQPFVSSGLNVPQRITQDVQTHQQMQHIMQSQQFNQNFHSRGGFPQPLRIPNGLAPGVASLQNQTPHCKFHGLISMSQLLTLHSSHTNELRFVFANSSFLGTSRSTEETKTVRPCSLGRKSSARNPHNRPERSFLARCHQRH